MENDERARVARRLRELSKYVFHPDNTYELLADALGIDTGTDELFTRLADLIEPASKSSEAAPDCGTVEAPTSQVPKCDRHALLALADEMEEKSEDWDVAQGGIPLVHAGYLPAYARRIREALGVEA